jgi:hypothetical protein
MTRTRIPAWSIGLMSVILIGLFAPVIVTMITAGNDYRAHIRFALIWEQTGFVNTPLPHFLYQLLLILLHRLLPAADIALVASLLSIICYLCLGLTLYVLLCHLLSSVWPRRNWLLPTIITAVLMLVAPVNILTWNSNNLYQGYVALHSYHNPTIVLLKPLALASFLFALKVFDSQRASLRMVFASGIITGLSVIAKPSYAICLLPALGLLTAYSLYRKRTVDWALLLSIALPILEVLAWQLLYYRASGAGGFVFAPLQIMSFYSPDGLLPRFFLSLLFPAAVLLLYFKAASSDVSLQLAWLTFAFGALCTYFLAETREWRDGNFIWSGQITLLILFIASALFLLRQNASLLAVRRFTWKFNVCTVILALHFVSGVAFYLPHLGSEWRSWL